MLEPSTSSTTLPATTHLLEDGRNFVSAAAREANVPERAMQDLIGMVGEGLSNVVEHAKQARECKIVCAISIESATVTLEYESVLFDTDRTMPAIDDPAFYAERGRGIAMMKALAAEDLGGKAEWTFQPLRSPVEPWTLCHVTITLEKRF